MIESYRVRGNRRLSMRRVKRELVDEVEIYDLKFDSPTGGIEVASFGGRFYNTSIVAVRRNPSFLTIGCRDGIDLVVSKLESLGYSLKLIVK
ncbi:MAG: hypothetical protein KKE50_07345 [Nanoarchaeota archaeon]|nr:hypothetical protein [Nanoarchaeota archaeon]